MPTLDLPFLPTLPLASASAGSAEFQGAFSPVVIGAGVLVVLWALACAIRLLSGGGQLKKAAVRDEDFLKSHQEAAHSLEVYQDGLAFDGSPKHAVYVVSCRELAFHLMGTDTLDKNFPMRLRAAGRITPSQMDSVRKVQERTAASMGRDLGSNLGGAGVNALPYIGLLAALVVVLALSSQGSGSSGTTLLVGALLPMVLAVVLFIPLMLWQHGLVARALEVREQLADFAVELAAQFDRAFVDHRKPLESLPSLESMVSVEAPTFSLPPSDTSRSIPVINRPA